MTFRNPVRQENDWRGHVVRPHLVYTEPVGGRNMNCRKIAVFGAALFVAWVAAAPSRAFAQTSFQNYRCADGTQFIVGFFQYDSRAHLQLDGRSVALAKRLSLSGSRYTGSGVTLKMTKAGATTLKNVGRPVTACELT
jgi:membrane-bound inhibitor of C-type lysozyme